MRRRRTNRESGVVLIAVLWGMVVLSAMAFALATSVRSGSEELRARKVQLQAHYMARGAVYKAVVAIGSTSVKPEEALFQPGQRELRWPEPNGEVRVEVNDESGKLDVNAAPEATLQRLLINLGLDFQSAHDMVAAIEDWRAPKTEPRLGGAGSGYYAMLPQPYKPASANFTSVEELLLVRGVTPQLFWGGYVVQRDGKVARRLGLVDCLTVYTGAASVNINYAPLPVLLALPRMDETLAGYMVEGRKAKPFTSVSDFTNRYPVLLDGETLSAMSTGGSGRYELVAAGVMPSGITARVRAVVQIGPSRAYMERASLERAGLVRPGPPPPPFQILSWDDSYVH